MSEMVERVARAIAHGEGDDYMENHREFDRYARSAIAAMRDPTEAMLESAHAVYITEKGLKPVYQVMIYEALKEK